MTPKEKAKDIYEKLHYTICNDLGQMESDSSETAARNSSIILCDEVIESCDGMNQEKDFWFLVKKHIQLL